MTFTLAPILLKILRKIFFSDAGKCIFVPLFHFLYLFIPFQNWKIIFNLFILSIGYDIFCQFYFFIYNFQDMFITLLSNLTWHFWSRLKKSIKYFSPRIIWIVLPRQIVLKPLFIYYVRILAHDACLTVELVLIDTFNFKEIQFVS